MDVLFGLSFGSRLNQSVPKPGRTNDALAADIIRWMRWSGHADSRVVVIVDLPIAIAMNSLGAYPDRILSHSGEGAGGALGPTTFFERAAQSLKEEPVEVFKPYVPVRYFIAAQRSDHESAAALARRMIEREVMPITTAWYPCDPASEEWRTRSPLRASLCAFFTDLIRT